MTRENEVHLLLNEAVSAAKAKIGISVSLIESNPQEAIEALDGVDFRDSLIKEVSKVFVNAINEKLSPEYFPGETIDDRDEFLMLANYVEHPDVAWTIFELTLAFTESAIALEISKIRS